MYIPPSTEALGLEEVTTNPKGNEMRAV